MPADGRWDLTRCLKRYRTGAEKRVTVFRDRAMIWNEKEKLMMKYLRRLRLVLDSDI
jgi:hypothetical protein